MAKLKLKDGTRATIKMGDTVIGYVTSLNIDTTYNISDANQLGSMFPIEQHIMGYKATVNTEFFVEDFTNHRFTSYDAQGNIIQTANRYDFKDKESFGNFLKAGINRFNLEIYAVETKEDMQNWINSSPSLSENLLFKIDNLLIQSESVRIQQGQLITGSASFTTTEPLLNHTALTGITIPFNP